MPQDFFPYINLFLCGRKFIFSRMPQDFFPYSHKFSTVYKFILIRIKIYGNTYINLVPSGCPKIEKFRRPGNLPRSSQREGVQTTCTPIIMISVQASSPSLGEGLGAPYFTIFLVVPSLIFRIFIPGSMRLRRLPSVP